MRTTIEIGDELMRTVKRRAADENATLKQMVERALRMYIAGHIAPSQFKLRWKPHARGRMLPGVVLEDRNSLFDLMDSRD